MRRVSETRAWAGQRGRRETCCVCGGRTKETNLNEMTCFWEVKSGELGFSAPSTQWHIHLERPGLYSKCINRQNKNWLREKKCSSEGSSLIIHSLFFERQKHILNSSWALKVCYLKGIFCESDYNTNLNEVKTETMHLVRKQKSLGGAGS